jgi:hypothetical protein
LKVEVTLHLSNYHSLQLNVEHSVVKCPEILTHGDELPLNSALRSRAWNRLLVTLCGKHNDIHFTFVFTLLWHIDPMFVVVACESAISECWTICWWIESGLLVGSNLSSLQFSFATKPQLTFLISSCLVEMKCRVDSYAFSHYVSLQPCNIIHM